MSQEQRPRTEGSATGSLAATKLNEREAGEVFGSKKALVDIRPYVEYIE